MNRVARRGITIVEVLIATSIVGIVTGVAVPTVITFRRSALAQTALTAIRAIDVAINSNCGRGTCGPFLDSGAVSPVVTHVPASLKSYLPTGFVFARDSSTYAVQLEVWTVASTGGATPMCPTTCLAPTSTGGVNDPGFTNATGYAAPPTITVSVDIITTDGDLAQALYARAGGAPPVYITSQHVWKYAYPSLVAVPATG